MKRDLIWFQWFAFAQGLNRGLSLAEKSHDHSWVWLKEYPILYFQVRWHLKLKLYQVISIHSGTKNSLLMWKKHNLWCFQYGIKTHSNPINLWVVVLCQLLSVNRVWRIPRYAFYSFLFSASMQFTDNVSQCHHLPHGLVHVTNLACIIPCSFPFPLPILWKNWIDVTIELISK